MEIVIHGGCGSFEAKPARLTEMRQAEAKRAALVLGESEVVWLGHPDFGLDRLGPGVLPKAYVRLIRPHRPQIAVTLDPAMPGEIHPDHRAFALAAAEAASCAHIPPVRPEQALASLHPHFVPEQCFAVSGPGRGNRFVDVMATLDRKPAALPARYSAYLQRRGLTYMEAETGGSAPGAGVSVPPCWTASPARGVPAGGPADGRVPAPGKSRWRTVDAGLGRTGVSDHLRRRRSPPTAPALLRAPAR